MLRPNLFHLENAGMIGDWCFIAYAEKDGHPAVEDAYIAMLAPRKDGNPTGELVIIPIVPISGAGTPLQQEGQWWPAGSHPSGYKTTSLERAQGHPDSDRFGEDPRARWRARYLPLPADRRPHGGRMTAPRITQGRRVYPDKDGNLPMQEGDYGKTVSGIWACRPPRCHVGELTDHEVTENEDGTITVHPSILTDRWHGYLVRGIWKEV